MTKKKIKKYKTWRLLLAFALPLIVGIPCGCNGNWPMGLGFIFGGWALFLFFLYGKDDLLDYARQPDERSEHISRESFRYTGMIIVLVSIGGVLYQAMCGNTSGPFSRLWEFTGPIWLISFLIIKART